MTESDDREHYQNDEKIPGTHYLVSLDHSSHLGQHLSKDSEIVLHPTPSADPNDPLNWTPRRKALATFSWCLYTVMNGVALSNVYSIEVTFSAARGLSLGVINAGTGYLFLLAGWGLLFWQPLALQYGKRPVYIFTLLALMAVSLWSPYCDSSGQWYARCIIAGFAAAPIEALPEASVADLYFAHERGTYMGLYSLMLVGSNFIAPLMFGFVNDGQGWEWCFYWPAIFCGVGAIILFFTMEETNYNRPPHPVQETQHEEPEDARKGSSNTVATAASSISTPMIPTKTYLHRISLKPTSGPFVMHHHFLSQIRFLTWPVVLYTGFAYGSTLIWFNVLNATSSLVLSSPPYSFKPSIVGLTYVAPLLGVIVAFFCVGRASDALVVRLSRRNNGIMEPEMRLWLFGLSSVLIPAALILWGVGSVHGVQWFGLTAAMFMLGFVNTSGASLSTTYLVDCYREASGDALTGVIIIRNTMSFAIGYGITPWIDNIGRQNAFISAGFVGLAASLLFLVMIKWGKQLRARSADAYWKLVANSKQQG